MAVYRRNNFIRCAGHPGSTRRARRATSCPSGCCRQPGHPRRTRQLNPAKRSSRQRKRYGHRIICGYHGSHRCAQGYIVANQSAFSAQTIGTVSAAKTVTLKNTGTATLAITGIGITGANPANFSQTHTCLSSLPLAASCTISVKFKPNATGMRTGGVSIHDNATGSPQRVALSGIGVAPSCTPIGKSCSPTLPRCCAAPFPHHSFCSSQTGFGVCLMN